MHGLVEHVDGFFVPSLALQGGAEACEIIYLRIETDGAGDPFDGVIVLAGLDRQPTHQMQAIGVTGVHRQRPLAATLRLQISSGLHMGNARLMQCGRAGGDEAAGSLLGCLGAFAAVASAHQRGVDLRHHL